MKKAEKDKLLKSWDLYYKQKAVPDELRTIYIDYAAGLLYKDVPVIFDLNHLSSLLGVKKKYLLSVIYSPDSHYREFTIPKHSGGTRVITSPYASLKTIQTWIYNNILSKIKVHRCVHGFKRKKSIITNARIHVENSCLLKLDIKDFFPSIKINKVITVFRQLGYTDEVSLILASLCCKDDSLPQGAPTSPYLSNIVSHQMDNRLFRLAKSLNLKYTRYADDIAFSGNKIPARFMKYVKQIIIESGYEINEKKVRIYNEQGNKILTGISLANKQLRLPRDTRREWSKEFHYILTYGYESHVHRTKPEQTSYLNVLLGRAYFWLSIEPNNSIALDAKQCLIGIMNNK